MRELEVFIDFISPFAYFGWHRARAMAERRGDVTLVPRPVLFAAMLDHFGQLGPAEIPPKRAATFVFVARYAKLHGIPLTGPKAHPFNPLAALRIATSEEQSASRVALVSTLFDAVWAGDIDAGAEADLSAALTKRGLDGEALLARTKNPEVKARLKAETDAALDRGIFGVPTFVLDGETFWGNDTLEHVELALDGKDPLTPEQRSHYQALPRGAERKR